MFSKSYGLFYKNGKWYTRNYGRVLKKGGFTWGNAKIGAWWRNRKGETPVIDLKRIVPQPWAKEEYGPAQEMIKELMASTRPMQVSYDDTPNNRT